MNALELIFASTIVASAHVHPAAFPHVSFDHQDWQLVCDNTRTCRAAGYQPDGAERNASLLLTRRAGPAAPVQAELQNAVLLKMDEFQGRLDTPGAIIRKGQKLESSVLPSLPVPEITAAHVHGDKAQPDLIPTNQRAALFNEARKTIPRDELNLDSCEDFDKSMADSEKWSVYRLSDKQQLVSVAYWSAAYNSGAGYWVVNAQPPFAPVYVTNMGTRYSHGSISSLQPGRGIGDCMSSDTWTWDGHAFVHTKSLTTGMCKLVAPGGTWELPTVVVKVNYAK